MPGVRTFLRRAGTALNALLLVIPATAPLGVPPLVVPAIGRVVVSPLVVPAAAQVVVSPLVVPAIGRVVVSPRSGVAVRSAAPVHTPVSSASAPGRAATAAEPLPLGPPPIDLHESVTISGGARAAAAAAVEPQPRFGWPLAGTPRPARRFDPPPQPWLPGHRGVDLAATPGVEVRAAGTGIVLFAGLVAGRPVMTIGHADGLRTTYEPVRPGLPVGAQVTAGTPIGVLLAGHPGCLTEACLHWGLRRGEEYLDPLTLLGLGAVRLLPLDVPAVDAAQPWASSTGRRTASRSYSSGVL
ncbi:Murein DD-endopeptidase MepM and murein hydrolase activator NlpD, contain LysM domain [Micromonospora eburnea]|uniref:Murein DD-endopeptidase MepM and murein hydrolase activator NlpD, contain LysM domain n=1 Tax=Micromonospora eburnea TaxID=227316 RepID=A0A1C6TYE4_9ACTN|nr:Murein DD-endopeptidase MepM and murein hydrolase activator NlpD, contain LysM domain [Micromonospora eburnea]